MMSKNFSLKTKIFALVSLVVVVSFTTLTAIVSSRAYDMAKDDAFRLAQESADKYRNEIIAELQGARITAETLSTVFETLKDHELTDRDMMNDILKNALVDKEYITAFCIAYDPDALDGKDALFAGVWPYDDAGRYAPYWNKLGSNIDAEPLELIDDELWYIIPKTQLHEYITEPYLFPLQDTEVLLESLVFPIIWDGKFIGIISSDIVLDTLQDMVANAHEQGGYTEIFSNAGAVAAHPEKDKLGSDFLTAHPEQAENAAAIMAAIANGEQYISSDRDYYTVYTPIRFSEVTNPWSVAVNIPMTSILGGANSIRNYGIIVSAVAIVIIAVILYLIANSVTRPILVLSNTAKRLGEGNFDIDVPIIKSNDEIGALSNAFTYMVGEINGTLYELKRAINEANAANEAKSLFLANMSHEIRTPLNAVMGLNKLLLDGDVDDTQRDYLLKMRRASGTLLGIVNNILDFSKVDIGVMELDPALFDPQSMFGDLEILFREQNSWSDIELRFEIDPKLPEALIGDKLRLEQIFINLLDNAYKFTESGAITVRANVANAAPDAVTLSFTVEDTGIGMDDTKLDEIFSVFNQADNSASRRYGGTGLGLALTRQVLTLMGGEIDVKSEVGHGTVFTFFCPFKLPEQSTAPDAELDAQTGDADNSILSGMRVLLVEDNEINTIIVLELLGAVGVHVTTAENGREALSRLAEARSNGETFDLVLMDLQMPVMDGYEATMRIKSMPEYKSMPIFALTAHAFPEERQRCLELGMSEHLTKPIEVEKFYAALREVARSKSV
jgi:signal transduction histidine kinase/ActR/RegA family two-component response regulator